MCIGYTVIRQLETESKQLDSLKDIAEKKQCGVGSTFPDDGLMCYVKT